MTTSRAWAMTTTFQASSDNELRERIAANLAAVRTRIADTGRDPDSVRIVAVTKTFGADVVAQAGAVGLVHVGENYLDELEEKSRLSYDVDMCWHYLGALQTNKIARIAARACVISGVSRVKEITKIAAARPDAVIDIQVDTTGREVRNGAPASEVPALVTEARACGLTVRGLMVVAPPEPDGAREAFVTVGSLADELAITERSMGMSDDFELACALGTTEIRLGRLLFGPREGVVALP